jgi:hypothetical protein
VTGLPTGSKVACVVTARNVYGYGKGAPLEVQLAK